MCTTSPEGDIALLKLGFPKAPPLYGLARSTHKLVGSFFNRHAVEVASNLFYSL